MFLKYYAFVYKNLSLTQFSYMPLINDHVIIFC